MYTSGTTANPKGCVLTHEALVRTGQAAAERWRLTHDERFWNPLPLFHMGGLFPLLAHFWVGATILTETRFDAGPRDPSDGRGALSRTPSRRSRRSPRRVINHPDLAGADLSALRLVNDTGAPDDAPATPGAASRRRRS